MIKITAEINPESGKTVFAWTVRGMGGYAATTHDAESDARKATGEIEYFYRGGVEVGTGNGYRWADGYSPNAGGNMTAPWMTKRQCQQDAKERGLRAVFIVSHGRLPKDP